MHQNTKNIICLIAIAGVVLFTLFNSTYSYPYERLRYLLTSGAMIWGVSLICLVLLKNVETKITNIDILLIGYLVFDVAIFIVHRITVDSTIATLNSLSLTFYFIVCKKIFSIEIYRKYLFYFIYGLSLLLSVGTIIIFINHDSTHSASGFFSNSGFNGILIAVTGVVTIIHFLNTYQGLYKRKLIFLLLSTLLIIVSVILTKSRTALLALMLIITVYSLRCGIYNIKNHKFKFNHIKFWVLGIILVGFLSYFFIYNTKTDSTNGRVFIWQRTSDIIKKNSFFGIGHNEFSYYYNYSQIKYFKNNPESNNIYRADNLTNPFNDYLYVFTEKGIVGISLLLTLIVLIVISFLRNKNRQHQIFYYILFCILICGLTSYSFSLIPQTIILVLLIANITTVYEKVIFIIPKKIFFCTVLLSILVVPFYIFYLIHINMWHKASESVFLDSQVSIENYNNVYPFLQTNGEFLNSYGTDMLQLNKINKAIDILETAKSYYAHSELFLTLGNSYAFNNNDALAEHNYLLAHYAKPDQFTPLFHLLELYKKQNVSYKGTSVALKIKRLKPKRESNITIEIKKIAQDYLLSNPHQK